MTADHTKFEELCALEASKQLSVTESSELRDHCARCPACNERLVELTQLGARLFSEYVIHQPCTRMSKEMLERFIARGKSEGVPLNSRAPVGTLGLTPVATAAFLLVMFLISATLYFGPSKKSSGQKEESKMINSVKPLNHGPSQVTPTNIASDETRITLSSSRRRVTRNVRRVPLMASHSDKNEWRFPLYSVQLVSNEFDPAIDTRSFILLRPPSLLVVKFDQNVYAPSARFQMTNFHFVVPEESAKADQPKLLAGFEYKTFFAGNPQDIQVFRPVEAQVVRREFDPEAYRMLLNPGLKQNLPVFQFTTRLSQ
jgi:hypothetical protein